MSLRNYLFRLKDLVLRPLPTGLRMLGWATIGVHRRLVVTGIARRDTFLRKGHTSPGGSLWVGDAVLRYGILDE